MYCYFGQQSYLHSIRINFARNTRKQGCAEQGKNISLDKTA